MSVLYRNYVPTTPEISSPTNNSRHYNNSINITWNTSTDADSDPITYHYQRATNLDFTTSLTEGNTSNIYTDNISTTDGLTYYLRVRSNDSYEYSPWSSTVQFTENSIPSILDPNFLRPPSPSITTNLTISLNITTDPEGDPITNHTLWYKNDVLNTSWNNSLTLYYMNNFTTSDSIYVKAYLRDGYENTSLTTSNQVIIGSSNNAPSISSISLNPTIRKYNKSVWINSSNITDDSSYIRLLTYYKLANESKVYLTNSSWFSPPKSINVSFLNPWSDSNAHYVYAQVEDSGNLTGYYNLTSGEVSASLVGDTTPPTVSTSSLSATSIYTGSFVTINLNTSLSNGTVSNVSVHISRPDATESDYVMSTSDNVTWTYIYTTTSDVGSYYIEYFSMQDDSGNRGTNTSTLTFSASTAPTGSTGGGGGGGTSTIVVVQSDNGTQEFTITNLTSTEALKNLNELGLCFTNNLMLTNKCAQGSISIVDEPLNWWVLFGSYIGSLTVLFILAIKYDEKKNFAADVMFYGTISWVIVVMFTFMGLNLYVLNYAFNSPLPGWMFLSFAMWGMVVTAIGDNLKKPLKISSGRRRIQ